ncbi:hypothetical protein C2W62_47030 [Candidatus Entotheonella serta]|nr:hypothetical protein C2W62_47030 [Candidatus Entotheonella serta]
MATIIEATILFDKGIHYVTFHGMVETSETNAFAMIDVFPDHLAIVGYGREPSRKLVLPAHP